MLRLENLHISFNTKLFDSVYLTLGNGEKVGLVGLNGTGKTTLLKIIAGIESTHTGKVVLQNEKVGYLPQEFDICDNSRLEFLGEFIEEVAPAGQIWKVKKALNHLKFNISDEFTKLESLSPGQKMKLYLAKVLVQEPTILLLDEPTNHLDLSGIEWCEDFINDFEGIVITISHDLEFLNNITDHILEIDHQKLFLYEGNYDDYLEGKSARVEKQNQQYKLQEDKREKLENLIALVKKQGSGAKQGKALKAARKRLQREVLDTEITSYQHLSVKEFNISGSLHNKKRALKVENLKFSYVPDKIILENINLEIYGGQKIWIKGDNGKGKTTLVRLLIGELNPDSGSIKWGDNLTWKYFAQNQIVKDKEITVQTHFTKETNIQWDKSFGILEKFLFDKDLRSTRVSELSPGQRSRLEFAIFAQKSYDCLILDEPTNHLDIQTKEIILKAIKDFKGMVLLVSHDRHFAKSLEPDVVWELK